MKITISQFQYVDLRIHGTLLWSAIFELDKSVNVPGLVEPKGNVISIQNRFDGKLKK